MAEDQTRHGLHLRGVVGRIGVTVGGLVVALIACLVILIAVGEATRS